MTRLPDDRMHRCRKAGSMRGALSVVSQLEEELVWHRGSCGEEKKGNSWAPKRG